MRKEMGNIIILNFECKGNFTEKQFYGGNIKRKIFDFTKKKDLVDGNFETQNEDKLTFS